MKHSITTGFSFGSTSGIITTLGLIVGLHSGTGLKFAVIGGVVTIAIADAFSDVVTIAIADAFSDALGIHISEEAEHKHSTREIWEATISTFVFKFLFTSTFIIPLLLFRLSTATIVSVVWGLSLLSVLSYLMARGQKIKSWKAVAEHLVIALVVITLTHYTGDWISALFK
jgi:VIT1/CCC1 family predicted Fe2+/Mn2+ transporter